MIAPSRPTRTGAIPRDASPGPAAQRVVLASRRVAGVFVPGSTAAIALALALAGCAGSPAPSYFVLGSAAQATPTPANPAGATSAQIAAPPEASDARPNPVVIVLDEVRLPEWLDRPQMTVQAGTGSLRVDESHRWGEPLAAGVERLIAAQLRAAQPGSWVAMARGGGTVPPPVWRIAVSIDTVQARPGSALSAWVRWQRVPVGEGDSRHAQVDQAGFEAPLADATPEALVDAWTRLATAVGRRIAANW